MPAIPISALGPDREKAMVSSLTLFRYHQICCWYLAKPYRLKTTRDAVHLGGVISGLVNPDEIAYVPDLMTMRKRWMNTQPPKSVVTENGWTRYVSGFPSPVATSLSEKTRFDSSCAKHGPISLTLRPDLDEHDLLFHSWLSQANYIFTQYTITTSRADCCKDMDLQQNDRTHIDQQLL